MATQRDNPFADKDRKAIWAMAVQRDFAAFVQADWQIVADDYHADGFFGIDALGNNDPALWVPTFESLESYKTAFEAAASEAKDRQYSEDPEQSLYDALTLSDIHLKNDRSIVVKRFNGAFQLADGTCEPLQWQSLFHLRKIDTRWKFTGFVGYLPL